MGQSVKTRSTSSQNLRCEFPKLMPNHLLGDRYIHIVLPIVYLELEPYEVG